MAAWSVQQGIDLRIPNLRGNALIHKVRNDALALIRQDSDFVLFVDDDMAPQHDALLKLLERDVPVVSALCTTRDRWPLQLVVKAYDEREDRFAFIEAVKPNAFLQGKFGIGAAFLLVKREVIDTLREYYLTARDWLDEHRAAFNRMHVRAEQREAERQRMEKCRREHFEREAYLRVFRMSLQDNQFERGEDVHLSRSLIALGIPIAIDACVQVLHIGEFGYGPHLLGINDSADLRLTA